MIGQYFNMMLGFFSEILSLDFGLGIDLGSIIIAFFTLLAFLRFFIKPILGGKLDSGSSRESKPKREK